MALVPIITALDGAVVVSLDLNAAGTTVVGASAVNGSTVDVTVNVTRPSGSVVSKVLAAGASVSVNIPKGRQFPYADDVLSDWSVSLTMG